MSNTTEKIKGKAEVVEGTVEKTVGKALGNEKMEHAGATKEVTGHARQAVANAAEHVADAADKIKHDLAAAIKKS